MKKQRRGLNRYNKLQDGKKSKKVSIHMHDILKTNCEEKKNQEKKDNKKRCKRDSNPHSQKRWLLVYIYSKTSVLHTAL